MIRLDELQAEFEEKYGEDWDREYLTEEEYDEWIEACFDYYENECEQKEIFGGPYSDMEESWYGHPFEIVERCTIEEGYDPVSLPVWHIRITDMEGDPNDPGMFAAYPEELFIDPREH